MNLRVDLRPVARLVSLFQLDLDSIVRMDATGMVLLVLLLQSLLPIEVDAVMRDAPHRWCRRSVVWNATQSIIVTLVTVQVRQCNDSLNVTPVDSSKYDSAMTI